MPSVDDTFGAEPADGDLVDRTRAGDDEAFAELWRRHYSSGIAAARAITSKIDPDDLVQESFERIYRALQKGGGPTGAFRAYLLTSIRHTAASWGRSRREDAVDDLEDVVEPAADHATDEALDRSQTHRAFRSLPTRWQEVLWYTEIEQMKPAEIAPLLGLKARAVAQLAFRAREGLREAWIQTHLQSLSDRPECRWCVDHLGSYERGNLTKRNVRRLESHLAECARCSIVAAEASEVSRRLRMIILPLAIGGGATTAYLATIQGGGAPLTAQAAGATMTAGGNGVNGGAVPQVTFASGAGAPATVATSTTVGTAGAVATGGTVATTGTAALVTLLLTGGVVATAVIAPQVIAAAPVVQAEDSAALLSLPESTDPVAVLPTPDGVGPGSIPFLDLFVSPVPRPPQDPDDRVVPSPPVAEEEAPAIRPAVDIEPSPEPTVAPTPEPTVAPAPEPTGAPAPSPDPSPVPTTEPTIAPTPEPTATPTVEPTAAPTPAPEPTTEPTAQPTETPTPEPTEEPTPEPTETPTPEPTDEPTPEPTLPAGMPGLAVIDVFLDSSLRTHIVLRVSGEPNTDVRVWMPDDDRIQDATLDAEGRAEVTLRPTGRQFLSDATVYVAYRLDDVVGEPSTRRLSDLLSDDDLAAAAPEAGAEAPVD